MPTQEDWVMRPVVRGMCKYESLKDGSLDLEDLARMNDAIAVEHDNEALARRILSETK
jgi:hypothetical protein